MCVEWVCVLCHFSIITELIICGSKVQQKGRTKLAKCQQNLTNQKCMQSPDDDGNGTVALSLFLSLSRWNGYECVALSASRRRQRHAFFLLSSVSVYGTDYRAIHLLRPRSFDAFEKWRKVSVSPFRFGNKINRTPFQWNGWNRTKPIKIRTCDADERKGMKNGNHILDECSIQCGVCGVLRHWEMVSVTPLLHAVALCSHRDTRGVNGNGRIVLSASAKCNCNDKSICICVSSVVPEEGSSHTQWFPFEHFFMKFGVLFGCPNC